MGSFSLELKYAMNPAPGVPLLWNLLLMMLKGATTGLGAAEPQPVDSRSSGRCP